MKWRGRRQSSNVEDRRRRRPGGKMVGGGLGTLAIVLIVWFLGGDPAEVLQVVQVQNQEYSQQAGTESADDELGQFVAVVLADTEDVWNSIFRQSGRQYRQPKLVIFSDQVQSACGFSQSATGPFYCPGDIDQGDTFSARKL